ncbi:unnamed protein product [Amoebophrya sp. A120]|nr:unnamed protein product [Amoebophrya sp. A120]|eukprot:GSA120T00011103001.1
MPSSGNTDDRDQPPAKKSKPNPNPVSTGNSKNEPDQRRAQQVQKGGTSGTTSGGANKPGNSSTSDNQALAAANLGPQDAFSTFLSNKKHFRYLKLEAVEKKKLLNERDCWPEVFEEQKQKFAFTVTNLRKFSAYVGEILRAVTFDHLPVVCGIQLLQFVLEHEGQLQFQCDPIRDALVEQPEEVVSAGDQAGVASSPTDEKGQVEEKVRNKLRALQAEIRRARVQSVSLASKRKAVQDQIQAAPSFLPKVDAKKGAPQHPHHANFDAFVLAAVKYKVVDRVSCVAALDAVDMLPTQLAAKTLVGRKKNQMRTKERYTHSRCTLFRENTAGYAELLILIRQLLYVATPDWERQSREEQQGKTIAHEIRRGLNRKLLDIVQKRACAVSFDDHGPGNAAQTQHQQVDNNDSTKPGQQIYTKLLSLLENRPTLLKLPARLTEKDVMAQIHAHCGAHCLDLGRVTCVLLDHLSFILSSYRLPFDIQGQEFARLLRNRKIPVEQHGANCGGFYDYSAIVRMAGVIAKLLQSLVPRQRIADIVQFRLDYFFREQLPLMEEAYRHKVSQYSEQQRRLRDAEKKWEAARQEQQTVEEKERDRKHQASRAHYREAERMTKEAERNTQKAKEDAGKKLQEVTRFRMEILKSYETLSDCRKKVLELRRGVDFTAIAYLIQVGLLDEDRAWSMLPCQLSHAEELEGVVIPGKKPRPGVHAVGGAAAKGQGAAHGGTTKNQTPPLVDDASFLGTAFVQQLESAHDESLKQMQSINRDEEKERAYELVLEKAQLFDTPQLRLLRGFLALNDWRRAQCLLEKMGGQGASAVPMVRNELATLLLWVLDPLVRQYQLDPAWHDEAACFDACLAPLHAEAAAQLQQHPSGMMGGGGTHHLHHGGAAAAAATRAAGGARGAAAYNTFAPGTMLEEEEGEEFQVVWDKWQPLPELDACLTGYDRQFQKFLRFGVGNGNYSSSAHNVVSGMNGSSSLPTTVSLENAQALRRRSFLLLQKRVRAQIKPLVHVLRTHASQDHLHNEDHANSAATPLGVLRAVIRAVTSLREQEAAAKDTRPNRGSSLVLGCLAAVLDVRSKPSPKTIKTTSRSPKPNDKASSYTARILRKLAAVLRLQGKEQQLQNIKVLKGWNPDFVRYGILVRELAKALGFSLKEVQLQENDSAEIKRKLNSSYGASKFFDQRENGGWLSTSAQLYTRKELDVVRSGGRGGNIKGPNAASTTSARPGGAQSSTTSTVVGLQQCTHIKDFLSAIGPVMKYLQPALHQEPKLLEILWKLTRSYLQYLEWDLSYGSGMLQQGGGTGTTSSGTTSSSAAQSWSTQARNVLVSDPRLVALLNGALLPACSMIHSMSEELLAAMWTCLSSLPGACRWRVYQLWTGAYKKVLPLPLVEKRMQRKVQNTLKRATGSASLGKAKAGGAAAAAGSTATEGGDGSEALANLLVYHTARLADSNPLVVFQAIVDQIAPSYNDNMIVPILAMTRKVGLFGADVAAFVVIQECFDRILFAKNKTKSAGSKSLLSEGVNIQGWLQNLSKWLSLFFAMHPETDVALILQAVADFIESHALQGLNAESFGNSLLQILVTDLVANMGAWSYVTELSDLQLESLSGGVLLRTENIYTQNVQFDSSNDTIKADPKAQQTLVRTLQQTGLVQRFWRSLGLMRRATTSDQNLSKVLQRMKLLQRGARFVSNLKKVGYLYDQTHQCLMSLTQFLGRSLLPAEYGALLPNNLAGIFADFETAFAYTMIRPALPPYHEEQSSERLMLRALFQREMRQKELDLSASFGAAATRNSSSVNDHDDDPDGAGDSGAGTITADKNKQYNSDGKRNEEKNDKLGVLVPRKLPSKLGSSHAVITAVFRYAFWRLELSDISCTPQYDKAINAYDRAAKDLKEELDKVRTASGSSRAAEHEAKKQKRDEKLEMKQKLKEERDSQMLRVYATRNRIQKEKHLWFTECSERVTRLLVSEFIAKRFLLSYEDALFCSNFVYLLVQSRTWGIIFADLGQKIVDAIAARVDACTEDEARILGVFASAFFRNAISLTEDKAIFDGQQQHPCLQKHYYSSSTTSNEDQKEYINAENLRWHVERWEKILFMSLKCSLKAKSWLTRRNALNILSKTVPVFPFTSEVGEKLLKLVKKIDGTDARQDMKLLAKSLSNQLKNGQKSWKNAEGISVVEQEEEEEKARIEKLKEQQAAAAANKARQVDAAGANDGEGAAAIKSADADADGNNEVENARGNINEDPAGTGVDVDGDQEQIDGTAAEENQNGGVTKDVNQDVGAPDDILNEPIGMPTGSDNASSANADEDMRSPASTPRAAAETNDTGVAKRSKRGHGDDANDDNASYKKQKP